MLHSRDSACRGADPINSGRVFEFWSDKCFVCKGFGVLRCDAESSAEEDECSGGVTTYVGYVGAPS